MPDAVNFICAKNKDTEEKKEQKKNIVKEGKDKRNVKMFMTIAGVVVVAVVDFVVVLHN